MDLDALLATHAVVIGDCLVWTGSKTEKGYAQINRKRVSRLLMADELAPNPKLLVRHTCDNPPCVRKSHLILGTPAMNTQDMVDRGRTVKPNQQLTDAEVAEIRSLYHPGPAGCPPGGNGYSRPTSARSLARRFGVSPATIVRVTR